ncbi:HNH endonuclease [Comamonas fluminis]|uniref:HNH endonuclease n=1 Tax=Comamonas fluminis TaxID=2796366 RepID=UPI001C45319F|nr:HNH endonuclease [Comamonas fluminis]
MSLSVDVVEPILLARGYQEKNRTKKKVAYQNGTDLPLYLNLQSKGGTSVLVAHPHSGAQDLHIDGVEVGAKYFHSSNMGLFPKHMHTGATPIPYGVGLTFDSSAALSRCLAWLEQDVKAEGDLIQLQSSAKAAPDEQALSTEGVAGQDASHVPGHDLGMGSSAVAIAPGQDASILTTRRVGHDRFRQALEQYWDGACAISGVSHAALLRASHIKPWAASAPEEKTSVFNGLLLAAQWDAAFDCGLITLDAQGEVVLSPQLRVADAALLGIEAGMRLRKRLEPQHLPYLAYHRQYVFLEGDAVDGRV